MTDKGQSKQNILLVDNNNIISEDKDVAEYMNNFFSNAVKSLNIPQNSYLVNNFDGEENMHNIDIIFHRYQSHPSIIKIKETFDTSVFF